MPSGWNVFVTHFIRHVRNVSSMRLNTARPRRLAHWDAHSSAGWRFCIRLAVDNRRSCRWCCSFDGCSDEWALVNDCVKMNIDGYRSTATSACNLTIKEMSNGREKKCTCNCPASTFSAKCTEENCTIAVMHHSFSFCFPMTHNLKNPLEFETFIVHIHCVSEQASLKKRKLVLICYEIVFSNFILPWVRHWVM